MLLMGECHRKVLSVGWRRWAAGPAEGGWDGPDPGGGGGAGGGGAGGNYCNLSAAGAGGDCRLVINEGSRWRWAGDGCEQQSGGWWWGVSGQVVSRMLRHLDYQV